MLPPVLHCRRAPGDALPTHDDKEDDSVASQPDDDDREEEDMPIRVADFVLPMDAPLATNPINLAAGRRYRLQRNPLALLLSESKDIMRPNSSEMKNDDNVKDDDDDANMQNRNENEEEEEKDEETFVLNVSYAGNEALESLVRVRLVADPAAVQELERVLAVKDTNAAAYIMSCANLYERHPRLIDCLTFYGYLLWQEVM